MRYIVIGAGAVGGAVGGWLSHTGREVVLVARGENGRVIDKQGLTVSGPDDEFLARPRVAASLDEWSPEAGDVLLLSVKSQDAVGLLPHLAHRTLSRSTVGRDLPLFCLQNGINNEREACRYFADVHGVSVTLPATHLEPGQVDAHGAPMTGILELGCYPNGKDETDERVARDLRDSNMLATARADVMAWKAAKLRQNLNNVLEALCGYTALAEDKDAVEAINLATRREARACFAAASIGVVDEAERAAHFNGVMSVRPVRGAARQGGSTWQSLARGLGSVETDFLNGEIVLLGRLHRVPTPVNEQLQTRIAVQLAPGNDTPPMTPKQLRAALGV